MRGGEIGGDEWWKSERQDLLRESSFGGPPIRTFPLKDRIDYIYYMGKSLEAIKSEVIDQHPVSFPSDHAGISTEFKVMW